MARDDHMPALFQLFRTEGYDGVSLAKIAEATGLGKASLYHHFPGGKDEMVMATLAYAADWLAVNVLQPLQTDRDQTGRETMALFQEMCDRLSLLYDQGCKPCLLATLTVGPVRDELHTAVKQGLEDFIEAIAQVLIEAGLSQAVARERGEDALVIIQGSLLMSRAMDDPKPFQRAMEKLPLQLCEGL